MLKLLILRFWPALLPVVLYALWLLIRKRRRPVEAGEEIEYHWSQGPWGWVAISSLIILVLCFIMLGLSADRQQGDYTPPHMEDGRLIDGQVAE